MTNLGFSKNQRVALSRIENFYISPFVVDNLDYNYTILHGLEKLEFNKRINEGSDFICEDFNSEDFNTNCNLDFSREDFSEDFY